LFVERLELVARPDPDHAEFEMVCGKGGYVRAIARDLGQALGCHAHVTWLRRTWSGPFDAGDGITLDQIEALAGTPELDQHLLPLEVALRDLPEVVLNLEGVTRVRNGNPGAVIRSDAEFGETCWASYQGAAVAVGTYMGGMLHPNRVFVADKG
jgi:tRNA pseudouridine55 synthase